MVIETPTDLKSLVDEFDFGTIVDLGSGVEVVGVFNRDFDQTLDVNGRRTTFRVVSADADLISIDQTITIGLADYIVRAKERGERTTVLILETT